MGFLYATALLGLAALAWPLYLHLRTQRRQVQVVPSLRLFGYTRRKSRRVQFEQLLLLLARVFFLAALAVLLAQPYLESRRPLPLPLIAGEVDEDPVLGIVLDESLTAQDGLGPDNRLERTRAWLREQLRGLPPNTKVRFAPTTAPTPTVPMRREEALAFLDQVSSLPQPGNAAAALSHLAEGLGGRRSLLLVAAPRSNSLWDQLQPGSDLAQAARIGFFDTSAWHCPVVIREVAPNTAAAPGQGDWLAALDGAPLDIQAVSFLLQRQGAAASAAKLSAAVHDAMRQRLGFRLAPTAGDAVYRLGLDLPAAAAHPWLGWYFAANPGHWRRQQAAILRAETPDGLLADRILTAVLAAARPELPLAHLDPARFPAPAEAPAAAVLLLAGGTPLSPPALEWLKTRLADGARLLCLPPLDGAPRPLAQAPLPAWGQARNVAPAELLPLRFGTPSPLWPPGLEELLRQTQGSLAAGRLAPPDLGPEGVTLLTSARGLPLLTARPLGGGGVVLALAWPPALAEDSLVYHPVFPLLLELLLLPDNGNAANPAGALVGQTVNLATWFDHDDVAGNLLLPGGGSLTIRGNSANPAFLSLDEPGPYVLRTPLGDSIRVANYPRLAPGETLFSRDDWARQRPRTLTRWLSEADRLVPEDFGPLQGAPGERATHRYDLSIAAVALVYGLLLLEVLALYFTWRRPDA